MKFTPAMRDQIEILAEKEHVLAEIIVWLKVKGLWSDCCKDIISLSHLSPLITPPHQEPIHRQNR